MDCSLALCSLDYRPKEATDLLDTGVVKANEITRTVFNETHGFACCSARQCVQRRIADRIVIVFHSWLEMFHFSVEGFGIHSLSCFKMFLGDMSDCPFYFIIFPALTALTTKNGSATLSTSYLKLECGRARSDKHMQKVFVRLFSNA